MSEYRSEILRELARSRWQNFDDNHDHDSLGEEPPAPPEVWKSKPLADAIRYYLRPASYFARQFSDEIARGEFLYGILADEPSRELLIKLIAYRILGHRKVKLSRNTPEHWRGIKSMLDLQRLQTPLLTVKFQDQHAELAAYDLRPLGYDLTCYASATGLACAVLQKQYEYHRGEVHCKAKDGDVVIDAGACWGETTLYFAHEAGPTGTVVAFEFIPSNLEAFGRNADLSPHLKGRIQVVPNPIWHSSGRKLYYVDWGPGSRVTDDVAKYGKLAGMAETVTIDETVERLGLARVDFIKMDIEGAELDALRGAEASIRKHRPALAISLYHNPEDIETIPRYLAGLDLGYRFYLDHHTIHNNETVLFGVPG
jgi:FkbM family methyltransferase